MRVFFWLLLIVPVLFLVGVIASVAGEAISFFDALGWWGIAIFAAIPVTIWGLATRFPSGFDFD